MKIGFLTGCLEPGANGVGDYSRLIAEEIVRQQGKPVCCLVALHDPLVNEPVRHEIEVVTSTGKSVLIPQLRLPRSLAWPERIKIAKEFLDKFSADAISLQFVPPAYNAKGWVGGLSQLLTPLLKNRQVQIMFHELWIEWGDSVPLKIRLLGQMQRRHVKQLVRTLKPVAVHVSNWEYLQRLHKLGIVEAELLPIFGNVPVLHEKADEWLFPILQENGVAISGDNRANYWFFGFFGSFRGGLPLEPLFPSILAAAQRTQRKVVVLSGGRTGRGDFWQRMQSKYAGDVTFIQLGEQPAERVSQFINSLDAGIAISNWQLIGKSGVAAAMFDHGLPVLVSTTNTVSDPAYAPPGVENLLVPIDANLTERLVQGLPRQPGRARLPEIAQGMLKSLSKVGES